MENVNLVPKANSPLMAKVYKESVKSAEQVCTRKLMVLHNALRAQQATIVMGRATMEMPKGRSAHRVRLASTWTMSRGLHVRAAPKDTKERMAQQILPQ